jgi:hypothetical protein
MKVGQHVLLMLVAKKQDIMAQIRSLLNAVIMFGR